MPRNKRPTKPAEPTVPTIEEMIGSFDNPQREAIEHDALQAAIDASIEQRLNEEDAITDEAGEAYLQTVAAEQSGVVRAWENSPIMELGEQPEPELTAAATALDPTLQAEIVPDEDLSAKLYAFSEQEREAMVYGVVDMENPVSEVAAAYNTDPQVVLLAIQMARLQKQAHADDITRNW